MEAKITFMMNYFRILNKTPIWKYPQNMIWIFHPQLVVSQTTANHRGVDVSKSKVNSDQLR